MIGMIVWWQQFRVRKILEGWVSSGRPLGGEARSPQAVVVSCGTEAAVSALA